MTPHLPAADAINGSVSDKTGVRLASTGFRLRGVSAGLILGVVAAGCVSHLEKDSPEQGLVASDIVVRSLCLSCHTIGEKGGTVGPVLDRVANRRSGAWLRRWLKNPAEVKPGTAMPNLQFSEADLDRLVADLVATKKPAVQSNQIIAEADTPEDAGLELMQAHDCFACHRVGATGRDNAPDLTWVGFWQDMEWEKQWLADPDAWKPGTFMPDFQLSIPEIDSIVAYLGSLQGQRHTEEQIWLEPGFKTNPRARGAFILQKLGCSGCHGKAGTAGGFRNPNAAPDQLVPDLKQAGHRYDEAQLRQVILGGKVPAKLDPTGPRPPLQCPSWKDKLSASDLGDLVFYLKSLSPG